MESKTVCEVIKGAQWKFDLNKLDELKTNGIEPTAEQKKEYLNYLLTCAYMFGREDAVKSTCSTYNKVLSGILVATRKNHYANMIFNKILRPVYDLYHVSYGWDYAFIYNSDYAQDVYKAFGKNVYVPVLVDYGDNPGTASNVMLDE